MLVAAKSGFGKKLAELREAAGLSQYQLAKASGVTAQTISRIELEERDPNWITILKLARTLDVCVEQFDTGEDPRQDNDESPAAPAKKKPKPKK